MGIIRMVKNLFFKIEKDDSSGFNLIISAEDEPNKKIEFKDLKELSDIIEYIVDIKKFYNILVKNNESNPYNNFIRKLKYKDELFYKNQKIKEYGSKLKEEAAGAAEEAAEEAAAAGGAAEAAEEAAGGAAEEEILKDANKIVEEYNKELEREKELNDKIAKLQSIKKVNEEKMKSLETLKGEISDLTSDLEKISDIEDEKNEYKEKLNDLMDSYYESSIKDISQKVEEIDLTKEEDDKDDE